MKKKALLVTIIILMLLTAPGILFSTGQQEESEAKIVIRAGHGYSTTHSQHKTYEWAQEYLDEKTGGRIIIKIFPNAQLGNERQMQEQMIAGTHELANSGVAALAEPAIALMSFPYLYETRKQAKAVMFSDLVDEFGKELEKKGLRIMGVLENGYRHITSNKPIRTPDDLIGFKIRTPEDPANIETFKALEAIVTPMSFNELYGALQQKVVDGQENPLQNIYNAKFWEVQKYINLTGHLYNFFYVLGSVKWWQTLSPEDQEVISEAIKYGCDKQIDFVAAQDEELLEKLKAQGMEVVYPDIEAFRKKALTAYESKWVKGLGTRGQAVLERIEKLIATTK